MLECDAGNHVGHRTPEPPATEVLRYIRHAATFHDNTTPTLALPLDGRYTTR